MLLFWHAIFIILMSSSVGIFVYIFEISKEASLRL
jgi:hypothetical protein